MTNVVIHTLFGESMVLTLVWHVCLPFSNANNSYQYDIKRIPNCTSGRIVVFTTAYKQREWDGWANKPGLIHIKYGLQFRDLCGDVCTLLIVNGTFTN